MLKYPAIDKMIKYAPFQKRAISPCPLARIEMPPSITAKRALIATKEIK